MTKRLLEMSATVDMRNQFACVSLLLLGLLVVPAQAQEPVVLFEDDFDRPDSSSLGAPWAEANETIPELDPGFVELDGNALAFHYVRNSIGSARTSPTPSLRSMPRSRRIDRNPELHVFPPRERTRRSPGGPDVRHRRLLNDLRRGRAARRNPERRHWRPTGPNRQVE